MADYLSQFTGSEIDARLAKVPQLETGKQDKLVSGTNIKTVGGASILGSGDIPIQAGDTDAVKYVAQTLTEEQKAQARANIDAASLADIADMDFVTAASLPTASASTMGHIYLIGPDANDNYDRYFTQQDGSSYSWVSLGSTQIDLSTYATKAEVTQLEAKVDSLPRGKDYGFFTSSSLLPSDATEEGFAYVGATEPYAIWQFDGTSWSDSGVTANAFSANDEQVADAVDDYLDEHPAVIGTFPNSAKRALVSLLEKVAFIDGNGQAYIDQLHAALNDIAIDHIVATFTQGTAKVYDLDTLDKLRNYLVVTAYFVDGTHGEIFDYELSGTLTYGTSTITVTADEDKTDTFEVTVTGTKKLYYNGDECSTVTGGWQTKGFNLTNGTPSKTKEASDLLIKFASSVQSGGAAGSWSSTNKIDLTGYTRLVVEVEAYNASGRGAFWAYWPNTLSEGTTPTAAYGSDYSSNRVTVREMGRASDTSTYPFPSPAETTTIRKIFGTSRTEAYISLNLNLYTDTNANPSSAYTAGAYVKIKRVFLATD